MELRSSLVFQALILLLALSGCDTNKKEDKQFANVQNLKSSNEDAKLLEQNQNRSSDKSWYALRNAVYSHDFDSASTILGQDPAMLSSTNSIGETVLHFVAVENDIEGVAWLYSKGADINTRNKFGDPVIFEVASLGYKELFAWFIKSGANLHVLNGNDQNIDAYLLEYDHPEMAKWIREHYK
jgi:ankyrin repeat protein